MYELICRYVRYWPKTDMTAVSKHTVHETTGKAPPKRGFQVTELA